MTYRDKTLKLVYEAAKLKDRCVNVLVQRDGMISVNISPVQISDENVSYEPVPESLKPTGWRKIEYGRDKRGERYLMTKGLSSYINVNVYCPGVDRVFGAYWSNICNAWMVTGAKTEKGDSIKLEYEPSHWMPLPEPPKEG